MGGRVWAGQAPLAPLLTLHSLCALEESLQAQSSETPGPLPMLTLTILLVPKGEGHLIAHGALGRSYPLSSSRKMGLL